MSKIMSVALVVCLMVSISACSKKSSGGEGYAAKTIRIEQNDSTNSFIATVMKINSILEKYLPAGVSVEYVNTSSGRAAEARDALISGNVDIISYGTINFITYLENGVPLRLIGTTISTQYKLYTNSVEINSMQDIPSNGKISVSSIGGGVDLVLRFATNEEFGDPAKFSNNLLVLSNSEALATLKGTNSLSAAMFTFPFIATVDAEENLKELYDFSDIAEEYGIFLSPFTSQDFYDKNPVLVKAYLDAVKETIDFIYANPEKAGAQIGEYWGMDLSVVVDYIKINPLSNEISEAAYDRLANAMYEFGMIDNKPTQFNQLPNYADVPKVP
jgi:NitT/TauT family transport system substrate-binding protein